MVMMTAVMLFLISFWAQVCQTYAFSGIFWRF